MFKELKDRILNGVILWSIRHCYCYADVLWELSKQYCESEFRSQTEMLLKEKQKGNI